MRQNYLLLGLREGMSYSDAKKLVSGNEMEIKKVLTGTNLYDWYDSLSVLFLIKLSKKYGPLKAPQHYFFNLMKNNPTAFKTITYLVNPIVGIVDLRARMRDEGILKEWITNL